MNQVEKEIWGTYKILKNKIKIASFNGDSNKCMELVPTLVVYESL